MANMNQMLMGMGGDGGLNVSGGNVTDGIEDGDYTYFVFTNASSSSLVVSGGPYTVDVLAIAGAGGGGSGHARGGGAGGLVEVLAQQIGSGTHAQSVGEGGPAGGPAAGSGNRGTSNGEPTVFSPGSPQYQIVVTGGGAELRNIISLAENSMGVKVRKGKPIKIDGVQDIADKPRHSTVMGLLLWPFYANDHIRMQKPKNESLKSIIKKIRHTIEEMF